VPAEECVRRARSLAEDFQVPQALLEARRARQLDEFNVEAHFLTGVLARRMNRLDEAIEALERACYLEKNLVMGHFLLGHIYQHKGKGALAKHHHEQVFETLESRVADEPVRFAEGMSVQMLRDLCTASQAIPSGTRMGANRWLR
jgi:chemotaxis protein methyltransferase CheR